jgi:hypothetical protein
MPTLRELAIQAHKNAAAQAAIDEQRKFGDILTGRFGLSDLALTGTMLQQDGYRLVLDGQNVRAMHLCPKCEQYIPGNQVSNLEELGAELQRPIQGHNCPKPKKE